ncbi:metal-dependent hydrolase [Acinetobacter modestus]|uniref:metal-dependent hydrolase n=1 Tax=Acinetobacter modestus TaxID=1776740 RepID=UPI00202F7623|nr:metal-dependent hydrolase [Acinetobacter modestus]MCM1959075.1 metal-dependent hydrolase [Acinetobacter modestus]
MSISAITNTADQKTKPFGKASSLGRDVGIPVRRMNLSYNDDMPAFWFKDNAFLSLYLSGFSARLPLGEGFFIHSVRLFQHRITDPHQLARVRAFIGQEAHHSREHDVFNNVMKSKGFDLDRIERTLERDIAEWKKLSPEEQLAITVCGEHYTALMADFFLKKRPELFEEAVPEVRKIWIWHCIEEIEHKSVAFDVYMRFVGDRKLLHRTMRRITAYTIRTGMVEALQLTASAGQM